MKILVGVDDSPHAQAAVDLVKRMPWEPGTQVVVVSVAKIPVQSYGEIYVGIGSAAVEAWDADQQACEQIAANAEAELQTAGFKTKARVPKGDPREALVELARAEQADLLVVGSHGRTGLSKLLMGSVASHVVTHAPCDVLVVKKTSFVPK
jgi:nucleotide-binding universal stress UspA family protein